MKLETLQRIGLDRRIAYKVKAGDKDECFLRFDRQTGRWFDLAKSSEPDSLSDFRTDAGALAWLIAIQKLTGGEVMAFACCCLKCHTTANKAVASEFYMMTGEPVSHGYWPECQPVELARLEADLRRHGLENPS